MNGCRKCPAFDKCTVYEYRGSKCAELRSTYGIESDPEIITNGDMIRSMSDEELAYFLNQWGTSTRAWQKDYGETLHWTQKPEEDKHGTTDI